MAEFVKVAVDAMGGDNADVYKRQVLQSERVQGL